MIGQFIALFRRQPLRWMPNTCVDQLLRTMNDSIEAELLAARLVAAEACDEPGWVDRYIGARARLDPALDPDRALAAARSAWSAHGWAHPAAVACLEHELGSLDDD